MDPNPQLFTTIRIEDGKPILLEKHLEKLRRDYEEIHKQSLLMDSDEVLSFLEKKRPLNGIWRLNLYTKDLAKPKLTKEHFLKKELSLKIYPLPFYEAYPHIKKEDFSKRLELLKEAQKAGFDDWIFRDSQGHFLETCIYNLFWIHGNQCYTPSFELPLYFGVTLKVVLNVLEKLGFNINYVCESNFEEIEKSMLFAVNSMKEILPVSSVNQTKLTQDKTVYETILKAFHLILENLDAHQSTCLDSPKKYDISPLV